MKYNENNIRIKRIKKMKNRDFEFLQAINERRKRKHMFMSNC